MFADLTATILCLYDITDTLLFERVRCVPANCSILHHFLGRLTLLLLDRMINLLPVFDGPPFVELSKGASRRRKISVLDYGGRAYHAPRCPLSVGVDYSVHLTFDCLCYKMSITTLF